MTSDKPSLQIDQGAIKRLLKLTVPSRVVLSISRSCSNVTPCVMASPISNLLIITNCYKQLTVENNTNFCKRLRCVPQDSPRRARPKASVKQQLSTGRLNKLTRLQLYRTLEDMNNTSLLRIRFLSGTSNHLY